MSETPLPPEPKPPQQEAEKIWAEAPSIPPPPTRGEIDQILAEGPVVPPPAPPPTTGTVKLGTVASFLGCHTPSLDGQPRSGDGTVLPCGIRCTARCADSRRPFCSILNDRQRKVLLHAPALMVREALQLRDNESRMHDQTKEALSGARERIRASEKQVSDLERQLREQSAAAARQNLAQKRWIWGLAAALVLAGLCAVGSRR